MDSIRSRELESKQLAEIITDLYDELHQDYELLSAPDGDSGIFKYVGSSPEAKFALSKISKKRDVQRAGIGFVIQRAELADHFRISFDLEITQTVTSINSNTMLESMNMYAMNEFSVQAPEFIIYLQPAHSGRRGWDNKIFVGIEITVSDNDFNVMHKLQKRIMDSIRKLFQAFDYALLGK